ncbi:MAG TPA: alpha-amylase family glycosyl hydrolase [Solirubrobacteraceae bacterium]|nr:alpha-amylase family glycosyl hydrolase [Solirubrobacteraceae bacterium]
MLRTRAAIVVLAAALSACVATAPAAAQGRGAQHSLRSPVTDESFYFVMADRFENGDKTNDLGGLPDDRLVSGFDPTAKGFYNGGDLRGLLQRIDYIRGLGTDSIWLTPSFRNKAVQLEDGPSAGYHGYWITDFTQIDPHLGTNDDLRALVDAAHARGMKVYFDIITNHTADVIGYEGGARRPYISKDVEPYRDAAGVAFDDRDFAGTSSFPPLDPVASFPYTPVLDPAEQNLKVPAWLNDVTLYHNRGDTTFTGEDSYYGDFFGLDDLFTEHLQVVQGMIDVYETWIADFGVDGFRIDTMKHVNDEFWQRFGPEVLAFARAHGKSEFFMFGEVFDTTKSFTSHFTTTDRMQAVLDFPFQAAAQGFAASSRPTDQLKTFFEADDWYTDADSNVYQLPTFLGNHDMGRIGHFVATANAGAGDAEWLSRDRLAHELMYLSRGNPVVYYGDEQGFTGSGGDQVARQTMFASLVPEYRDDDLIGTTSTHAQSNFEPGHPLYQSIAGLAQLTRSHGALRDGAQQHRLSQPGAGVYAFSRIDREQQREYLVALNNAEAAKTAAIPTYAGKRYFKRLYGDGPKWLRTDGQRRLTVTVPALSAVVYKLAGRRIPGSKAAPPIALDAPAPAAASRGRIEVRADVGGDSFYEVTFLAKSNGRWRSIGTDDNAPYRVFHDVSALRAGSPLEYRAVVLDNRGHTRSSGSRKTTVPVPVVTIEAPAEGAKVRGTVQLRATVDPERATHVVAFERSVAGGAWTQVGSDDSSPAYVVFDDLSALGLATGTPIAYRAILTEPDGTTATSAVRTVEQAPPPVTTAVLRYFRTAGDYAGWGLHMWGDAVADSVLAQIAWDKPWPFTAIEDGWARYDIPLKDDTKPVNFIMHLPSGDTVPDTREPGGDRSFVPSNDAEVWIKQGDPTVYPDQPATG